MRAGVTGPWSTLCSANARSSPRKAWSSSSPKRLCSNMTEKSVGSWSSRMRTPSPMAWGCPAGTRTASPAVTAIGLSAARRRSSCASTRSSSSASESSVPEPHPDRGARFGDEDDPGLGLAVVAVEVGDGELAARVRVDGQALTAVEQLGEQVRVAAEAHDVLLAEPAGTVAREGVGQVDPVGQGRPTPAALGEEPCGRADPVLGSEAVEVALARRGHGRQGCVRRRDRTCAGCWAPGARSWLKPRSSTCRSWVGLPRWER